jgi:hypothetical protein
MAMPLVFLGGTSGRNRWRSGLIERLVARGVPRGALFDPVVADWNDAAREREERAKANAEVLLFYLGDPEEPGIPLSAFTLVEATLAVCREPERAIVVFDLDAVSGHARKVYEQSADLLRAQRSVALIVDHLGEAEDALAQRFATD